MKINNLNYRSSILCFLLFFLPINNAYGSDLDELFFQLKNAENPQLAKVHEGKIWEFWLTAGSSKINNTDMQKGVGLMQSGQLDEALKLFINLSKSDPEWAEPFNKIATIRYLQGDLYGSIRDIQLTLKLEPRHFGAISGLVQINIILKEYKQALKNLDYVLKIHPFIGIKKLRPYIQNLLKKSSI